MSVPPVRLGLRTNWRQFVLLVAVNAFVGVTVGTERTLVPLLGSQVFGLASSAAVLSFLVSFGLVKALANAAAGHLADLHGRRRVLVAGWLAGIPVPIMLLAAPPTDWWLVVLANAFLGVNQGLCWSMTVVSKIDLVMPEERGLAAGLNEFAGYVAVGATALATGFLAASFGIRPVPILLGLGAIAAGLTLSVGAVRETRQYAVLEGAAGPAIPFRATFAEVSWKDRSLFACSQGGLVNNLNDAVAWGLLPLFLAANGLGTAAIGLVAGIYPLTWGILQLLTGRASDKLGRKALIVSGMWLQALAFVGFVLGQGVLQWSLASVLLGVGTALVYPTYLSAVSDLARPEIRGAAVGVYRFWRDLGIALGAVIVGSFADAFSLGPALLLTAVATFASGIVVLGVMVETRPGRAPKMALDLPP